MAILEQASVLTDAIRPVPAKELEQRLEKQNPEGARRLRQWERELRWKKEENETI